MRFRIFFRGPPLILPLKLLLISLLLCIAWYMYFNHSNRVRVALRPCGAGLPAIRTRPAVLSLFIVFCGLSLSDGLTTNISKAFARSLDSSALEPHNEIFIFLFSSGIIFPLAAFLLSRLRMRRTLVVVAAVWAVAGLCGNMAVLIIRQGTVHYALRRLLAQPEWLHFILTPKTVLAGVFCYCLAESEQVKGYFDQSAR